MAIHLSTLHDLQIAIIKPTGLLMGGAETDELKLKASNLIHQGNRRLILDLSGLSYMNSTGLGTILHIHKLYSLANGRTILCGMGKNIQNLFIITKLTSVFEVVDSLPEAIDFLQMPTKKL